MPQNTITAGEIDGLIDRADVKVLTLGDKTTLLFASLENGFVFAESSSCVDPKNYNEAIGREICLNKIKNKLWELEGYRLQCEIYKNKS